MVCAEAGDGREGVPAVKRGADRVREKGEVRVVYGDSSPGRG